MKTIDILLATYNGEEYLKKQLDSILNQTNTSWRLLIHDDDSSDSTVSIIREYSRNYPNNIFFIEDNIFFKNAIQNFNFLLEKSTASYIMFCDQDDIWLDDKIENTLNKMQKAEKEKQDEPILIHTNLEVVDNGLNVINNSFWNYERIDPSVNSLNRLLVQNTITGCTMMINRKLAELATPIPFEVNMHDSWLGLVASYFGKIGIVHKSTIQYRQHSSNSVGTKGFGIQYILNKLLQKNVLLKNSLQAKAFLDRYRDILDNNTAKMLEDFSTIESKPFWLKRKILLKHKLLKQGFIRNIGLMVKI